MYDPMACSHDNEEQLDRRHYKKETYAMPSHVHLEKKKQKRSQRYS